MRWFVFISLCFFLFTSSVASAQENTKLVVGIVVDQMRQDYLNRFESDFEEGGFKRLMHQGYEFTNAHYSYVPTYTAPGHASIYTGTTPAFHGIIGNNWFDKVNEQFLYCVQDDSVATVGSISRAGEMSPKNLKAQTITDQFKLNSLGKAKVVGLSIKDRGAVLPAGHMPDGAYWYDAQAKSFITSTFYADKLPQWVSDFNDRKLPDSYLSKPWETLKPLADYDESRADDNAFERVLRGEDKPVFPHNLALISKLNGPGILNATPFGNDLVAELAKAAIEGEEMGRDDITDFLAVSFSSTDYVGHAYGPYSVELQDAYLRLDRTLADLFAFLDKNVGKGEYLIFLTADHGAAENPNYLRSLGFDAQNMGYFNSGQLRDKLMSVFAQAFGDSLIKSVSNQQVFLNWEVMRDKEIEAEDVYEVAKPIILSMQGIGGVITRDEVSPANMWPYTAIANGFSPTMSGDIIFYYQPGWIDYSGYGTTHSSFYTYDTNVPLLFFGRGIKQGKSSRRVHVRDIAPTVAGMFYMSLPNSTTGDPLPEILGY